MTTKEMSEIMCPQLPRAPNGFQFCVLSRIVVFLKEKCDAIPQMLAQITQLTILRQSSLTATALGFETIF